jgi:lysozyme
MSVQGIDVSHYQGTINWASVAQDPAGVKFAYAKASQGTSTVDAQYANNYAGMKANGIMPGAYHFFDPSADVTAQVNNFIAVVGKMQAGDLPPAIDVEQTSGMSGAQIFTAVQAWITQVQAALGCSTPIIYTSASFWNGNNVSGSSNLFTTSPLWVAQYTSAPAPNLPTGASVYTFWQYSESGSVAGMTVDMDKFNGSLAQLQKFQFA